MNFVTSVRCITCEVNIVSRVSFEKTCLSLVINQEEMVIIIKKLLFALSNFACVTKLFGMVSGVIGLPRN